MVRKKTFLFFYLQLFFHFLSLSLIPNITFIVYQFISNYEASLSLLSKVFIDMELHFFLLNI